MNIHITPKATAIAALITAGATAIALGPLNPPPGPVSETSPSLAEIKATLDQLVATQSGDSITDGPFDTFTAPLSGSLTNNFASTLIAEGRVYVDSISVQYAEATLFDGPGNIGSGSVVTSGTWICRSFNLFATSGNNGVGEFTTTTTPVRTVVENGLYAAWNAQATSSGSITVRYKRLPDLPLQGANE